MDDQNNSITINGNVAGLVHGQNPHVTMNFYHSSLQTQQEMKIQRLRSMTADHSGFMNDRLDSFVGREKELIEVENHITALKSTGGYLLIQGKAGQGKSSLIAKLIEKHAQDQGNIDRVAFHFIPFNPGHDHQVSLLRNLMARLIIKYNLSDLFVASESRPALYDAFSGVLNEVTKQGKQEIIFIDGIDQLKKEYDGQRDLSFFPQGPNNPPSGIVFVLGTRPDDTIRSLEFLHPHNYTIPDLSRNDFDLVLHNRGVSQAILHADHFVESLYITLKNALYLDLVAKELTLHDHATQLSLNDIITTIAENPENLFGLAIERLKQPETQWERIIKPVLGLLLTSGEALTYAQLKQVLNIRSESIDGEQLSTCLERLGGFIITDGERRYTFFHLKFGDYLRQDAKRLNKRFIFDIEDEQNWHRHFIKWCELNPLEDIWEDCKNNPVEMGCRVYSRRYYIFHLFHACEWNKIFDVLDNGTYGKDKIRHEPSTHSYASDLILGQKAAISVSQDANEAIKYLPYLWRYTLLRCSLASRADNYPEEAFQFMRMLKLEAQVAGLAELLTDPVRKVETFLDTADYLTAQTGREYEAAQVVFRAEELANNIEDKRKQGEALYFLVETLSELHQWTEIKHIILNITSFYWKIEALSFLGESLFEAQMFTEAREVWEDAERIIISIPDQKEKEEALGRLETALIETKQWSEAERLLVFFSESREKAHVLHRLGEVLLESEQWEQSERFQEASKKILSSIPPEREPFGFLELTMSNLSKQYEQANMLGQKAKSLIEVKQWCEAKKTIKSIPLLYEQVLELIFLGRALFKDQQWCEAESVFKEVENVCISDLDSQDQAIGLSHLGCTLVELQQQEAAKRIWVQTEKIIMSISELRELPTELSFLGEMLVISQHWDEAERIITSIPESYKKTKALKCLGEVLIQEKQWKEAERIITSIPESYEKAEALGHLGEALIQERQWKEAERIIASISHPNKPEVTTLTLEEGSIVPIHEPDKRTTELIYLAEALVKEKRWKDVERITTFISDSRAQAKVLDHLGEALIGAKRWKEAERIVASIPESHEKAEIVGHLGEILIKAQRWKELEKMINSGLKPHRQSWVLSHLGQILFKSQQMEEAKYFWTIAEEITSYIQVPVWKIWALARLAEVLAEAKQWAKAERIISSISEPQAQAKALGHLGEALAEAKQWAKAKKIISSISESREHAEALGRLGEALAEAKQWAKAERITILVPNQKLRDEVSHHLVEVLVKKKQYNQTERMIASISEEEARDKALNCLGMALVEAKDWMEAERIIVSIANRKLKDEALSCLGSALAYECEWKEVERIVASISELDRKIEVLSVLAKLLISNHEIKNLIQLIQDWCLKASNRIDAIKILTISFYLVPLQPSLGTELYNNFTYVNDFLGILM